MKTCQISEQDHRFIKRKMRPGLGFGLFPTAWNTLRGIEAMNMIRKGQLKQADISNLKTDSLLACLV